MLPRRLHSSNVITHGTRLAVSSSSQSCLFFNHVSHVRVPPRQRPLSSAVTRWQEIKGDFSDSSAQQVSNTETASPSSAFDALSPLRALLESNGDHHDLNTFLQHQRLKLSNSSKPRSSTYLGTRYEYMIQRHFRTNLDCDLLVVGGRGDSGIDLIGAWRLPSQATSNPGVTRKSERRVVKLLVQAKRLNAPGTGTAAVTTRVRRPTPSMIRELEGTLLNLAASSSGIVPSAFTAPDVIGILVCTRPATDGVLRAMGGSRRGLIYICMEEVSNSPRAVEEKHTGGSVEAKTEMEDDLLDVPGTRVVQISWNAAASSLGLDGFNVGTKYDEDGDIKEATLLWQGRPIDLKK